MNLPEFLRVQIKVVLVFFPFQIVRLCADKVASVLLPLDNDKAVDPAELRAFDLERNHKAKGKLNGKLFAFI